MMKILEMKDLDHYSDISCVTLGFFDGIHVGHRNVINNTPNCEKVIVLNWGMYSDSGTAWECGYAYAKQKEVITLLMPSREKEYSLMMINGSTKAIPWLDFIENREWANLNAINQK